jgi:hypothetical protein
MNAVAAKPSTVGKPLLALVVAGAIAIPAATGAASVETGRPFHLLPAEVSEVTVPVELTGLSYAGFYNLATAIGNAAFAGLDVVFLPLSVGYLVANLQTSAVPAYLAGVQKAVTGAIPGLAAALHALFGGGLFPAAVPAVVKSNVAAVTPAVTPAASLGGIYAGFFNLATAIGNASFAGLQVVFLPLSVGYLVANLQTSAVPAYLKGVVTNLGAAIPGIVKALQALVGGVVPGAVKVASVTSTALPQTTHLVTLSTTKALTSAPVGGTKVVAGTQNKTLGGKHSSNLTGSAGSSTSGKHRAK